MYEPLFCSLLRSVLPECPGRFAQCTTSLFGRASERTADNNVRSTNIYTMRQQQETAAETRLLAMARRSIYILCRLRLQSKKTYRSQSSQNLRLLRTSVDGHTARYLSASFTKNCTHKSVLILRARLLVADTLMSSFGSHPSSPRAW